MSKCIYIIYWKFSGPELFDQNDGDQTTDMANTHDQSKELILSFFKNPRATQLSMKAHQKMNIVVENVVQSFAERRKEIT